VATIAVALPMAIALTTVVPAVPAYAVPAVPNPGLIAAGTHHTCALADDGTVWCWGTDDQGQLGDGTANLVPRIQAQRVDGVSRAIAVAAGAAHTCALLANGTAQCWGDNRLHQLGNATNVGRSTVPVGVIGLDHAVAISARGDHTCALIDDGTLKCWGDDQAGGLHPNAQGAVGATTVPGVSDVLQVATGLNNDCAVIAGGAIECWGTNKYGQLGDGTKTSSATPVTVAGLGAAVAVAAGNVFTCAILDDGTAWCWGKNNDRALGDTDALASLTPLQIGGLSGAVGISAMMPICAYIPDQTLRCWGKGTSGEMGNGAHHDNRVPEEPVDLTDVVGVSVGGKHVCAAISDGTAKCWGDYSDGATGVNSPFNVLKPTAAAGFNAGTHALGNDERSQAQWISALPFTDSIDPAEATADGADPAPGCASTTLSATAWYSYSSATDASVTLSTPSDGTVAAAYVDTESGLTELGCATAAQDAVIDVSAGKAILVMIGSDASAWPMTIELSAGPAPTNDDFADAADATALPFSDDVQAATATIEDDEPAPSCAPNQPPFGSVWYRYDATVDETLAPSASGYALRVAVYTGTTLTDLVEIACVGGSSPTDRFTVQSGTTYYIQVYGLSGSGHLDFSLDVASPVDSDPPVIDAAPSVTPLTGASLANGQIQVTWSGHDDDSGIATYELQRRNKSGAWKTVATTSETSATLTEKVNVKHTFRVRAADVAGNVSDWTTAEPYKPLLKQEGWAKLKYSSGWKSQSDSRNSGGKLRWTKVQNATVTFTFTGRSFEIVSGTASGHGQMKVTVDGVSTNVDLSSSSVRYQVIVFAHSWTTSSSHTIELKNITTQPIDLDAVVITK
jgi:alpha-tubulin suppressor-like RCC1 family protein